jgi:DNA-binding Lrp family transcriptional regulator
MMSGVDAIDRKILAEVQADGRVTITDLAHRVGLSLSPCHRRLRALEQSGVIAGYRAHLDAVVLGWTFEAIVFVTMDGADHQTLQRFEEALVALPQVLRAQRMFGEPDYLLRVVARDLPGFQVLYDTALSTLPGVRRLSSTLVMKNVVVDRPLPL